MCDLLSSFIFLKENECFGLQKALQKSTQKAPQKHPKATTEVPMKRPKSTHEAFKKHTRGTPEAPKKQPTRLPKRYILAVRKRLFSHLFFNTFCSLTVPNKPLKTLEDHTRSNPEDLNRQRSGRAPVDVKSKTKQGIRKCIFLHFPIGK